MNLALVFSRKCRWPEHYFSVWCLGNFQKLLTTNQYLASTILFTNLNISFFNLRFDSFSIIAKKVNQIRNLVVCVVARFVFVFCCALTTKSEFYDPYFQIMLFLVTMVRSNIPMNSIYLINLPLIN